MNIEIANRLIELRKKSGLSQEQLAEKLGLSRQAVSKWEHGVALPDIMTLYAMCRLFGVTMEQLITSDIAERLHAIRLQGA